MFHALRTLAFIACLMASHYTVWWIGVVGLVCIPIVIPSRRER